MITFTTLDTPVGTLSPHIRSDDDGEVLIAVLWDDEPVRAELVDARQVTGPAGGLMVETIDQLRAYFDGTLQDFTLPVAPSGTPFQLEAWHALTAIPYGATSTYAQQATRIGRPSAVRAVGAANGRNPIPIIVPCHRVIGTNGSLTGFAGGLDAKRWLLDHERRVAGTAAPQLF